MTSIENLCLCVCRETSLKGIKQDRISGFLRASTYFALNCPCRHFQINIYALSISLFLYLVASLPGNAPGPPEPQAYSPVFFACTWFETTVGELYAYFAILIYMGSNKQNQVKDYWRSAQNRLSHLMLQKFKGCSKDSMVIPSKVGGQGFKVYTLCWENYILGAHFTSKVAKIDRLKRSIGLRGTFADHEASSS